jgi:pyruvate/2-oxoacid:ferredoxin oxidoreductase alpha subunit
MGSEGILSTDLKRAAYTKLKAKIKNVIIGLGGRDVTEKMIIKVINSVKKQDNKIQFIGE